MYIKLFNSSLEPLFLEVTREQMEMLDFLIREVCGVDVDYEVFDKPEDIFQRP